MPVVAVAVQAPAFAASCRAVPFQTMDLATKTGTDNTTLTITNSFTVTGISAGPENLGTNTTGMAPGWLKFQNRPRANGGATNPTSYQDITFTFSQQVTSLEFDVRDLDTSGYSIWGTIYDYWDRLAITGTTATYISSNGGSVSGTGTLANPWRQTTFTLSASDNYDTGHAIRVTFTSPVTSFTFRYWSSHSSNSYDGTQAVWIGNMTYKTNCT